MEWNSVVPELVVNNYEISKKIFTEIFGFNFSFERPEDRFVYLDLGGAQIMLLQSPGADIYQIMHTGPNGKGLHFQIELNSISEVLSRLQAESIPLAPEITE